MAYAPYIPNLILEMILMRLNPKDAISYSLVCKEWKSAVERCRISIKNTPWLFVSTQTPPGGEGDGRYLLLKASDSGATSMEIKITGIQDTELCIGTYRGWLVLKKKDFQEAAQVRLSLLNPLSGARKDLPVVQAPDVTQLFLFSDPTTPVCVAVVKDNCDYNILWNSKRNTSWNRVLWMTVHPADAFNLRRVNLIKLGCDLFVGMDHHANWTWEFTKTGQPGQIHIMRRELPSPAANVTPHWTSRSKYLVESVGGRELWYVIICRHEQVAVSNSFVFRWHTTTRTWSEVQRLDGVALLLDGNRLMAVSSHETGCRENCIYMVGEPPAVAWRVYDRNDHSITNVCGTGIIPDNVSGVFWIMPS